jgi:hypothetical protein
MCDDRSRKPVSIKGLVKRLQKIQRRLDASSSETATPGSVRNAWGTYWDESAVREMAAINKEMFLAISDRDERAACGYRTAGFLWSALQLDDAVEVCDQLMELYPDRRRLAAMKLKSQSLACMGRIDESLALARQVNADPEAGFFLVDEDELRTLANVAVR